MKMPNYTQLARDNGMSRQTLCNRLKNGGLLEDALSKPVTKIINHGITAVAKQYDIPYTTLFDRMKTGRYATLEDAAKPARQKRTGKTFRGTPCKICGNDLRYTSCNVCTLTQHHSAITKKDES